MPTHPFNRRSLLQAGALTLGGLTLPDVLAAREASGQSSKDTSVILCFLSGGPSQLETYDVKPDIPSSYRGVYEPINTNVPGIDICDKFPLQAKIADKFSLIRSLYHTFDSHSDSGIVVMTGRRPRKPDPTSRSKSEHPDFGCVASKVRGMSRQTIPPYVGIPSQLYMTQPSYLGRHHRAFSVGDPSAKNYSPPRWSAGDQDAGMVNRRRSLLNQLDQFRSGKDLHGSVVGTNKFRELAYQLLTSPKSAQAFDISKEKAKTRDRYGRHPWGQACLLARRLAEAGTSVITIYMDRLKSLGPLGDSNWDDHPGADGRPGHYAKFMTFRMPYLDQCLSALIEDIHERALDKRIMVIAMGEFGRTPRISVVGTNYGRDHWPMAYSALVSGGGLKMGQVVGATNSKAEYPTEKPYRPEDLLATVYRHLGIDPRTTFSDFAGRPIPILDGAKPIRELM